MIRRNIMLDDGRRAWLLISQIAHARISGALTRAWREPFAVDVIEAIAHHDDGWAKWEASPQLDVARGRPLSFVELNVADAIEIWNDSIAGARRIGPLAGAIVAGHFSGLAGGSDHARQPNVAEWIRTALDQRAGWLVEWQSSDSSHTSELADRAQHMLYAADLLSLWLCCDGPIAGDDDADQAATIPNTEMASRTSRILGKYHFSTESKSVGNAEILWCGSLAPWPFAVPELDFESPALAVPVAKYAGWDQIIAVGSPVRLGWQLRETLPPESEC
jgi:Protein of unknown function (DUF3891)